MSIHEFHMDAKSKARPGGNERQYTRTFQVDGIARSYIVHVPPTYDAERATPLVLVLHGGFTNGAIMETYTGFDSTADKYGFIVMYPNGTGTLGTLLFWNECQLLEKALEAKPDDVKFLRSALDDVENSLNIDAKRIYATGFSDGGIMCYRLASEMNDRIAAIASVSGPMYCERMESKRPVPILHIHGTDDKILPYGGRPDPNELLRSVDETIRAWIKINGCYEEANEEELSHRLDDGTSVKRFTYSSGKDGSEVVLMKIIGGGHAWPDRPIPPGAGALVGKVTHQVSANDLIWSFFEKHPMQ